MDTSLLLDEHLDCFSERGGGSRRGGGLNNIWHSCMNPEFLNISVVTYVSYFSLCCCDEHHDHTQLGEEKSLLPLRIQSPSLREAGVGTHGRNLEARTEAETWRNTAFWLAFLGCWATSPIHCRIPQPVNGTVNSGLDPSTHIHQQLRRQLPQTYPQINLLGFPLLTYV